MPAPDNMELGAEVPDMFGPADRSLYCRATDPFNASRVAAVLAAVRLGDDLSTAQRQAVTALLREFADVFALSIAEVFAVPDAVLRLNIPDGTVFSRKIHQKSLTPPQRAYLHTKIDEMLEAGVPTRKWTTYVTHQERLLVDQSRHMDDDSALSTNPTDLSPTASNSDKKVDAKIGAGASSQDNNPTKLGTTDVEEA